MCIKILSEIVHYVLTRVCTTTFTDSYTSPVIHKYTLTCTQIPPPTNTSDTQIHMKTFAKIPSNNLYNHTQTQPHSCTNTSIQYLSHTHH
jgi:hypothetical protein